MKLIDFKCLIVVPAAIFFMWQWCDAYCAPVGTTLFIGLMIFYINAIYFALSDIKITTEFYLERLIMKDYKRYSDND